MASRSSSVDLTSPTKRSAAQKVLHQLSVRLERTGTLRSNRIAELLHPFNQDDDTEEATQEVLKEAAQKLRQQVYVQPKWFVLDPKGLFRTVWDFFAILMVLTQAFCVPLWIAYYSEDQACNYFWVHSSAPVTLPVPGARLPMGFLVFVVCTNYFFVVDIVLNFITGAIDHEANLVIWDVKTIATTYLRKWFWVDLAANIPLDCILVAAASGVNWYNWGKAIRLLRLSTIARRAHGSPYRFFDRISDVRFQFSYAGRRILHVVLLLFYTIHWFACLLWFVNRVQSFPGSPESCCSFPNNGSYPWLLGIVSSPVIEQYLWSFFNIISGMIGLGYGAFPPITWPEALLWVFAMIVTAGTFALLNGLVVASIITGSSGRAKYKDIMDKVVDMLQSRQVPRQLSERVLEFYKFKYAQRKIVGEDDVLKELPQSMRAEVILSLSQRLLESSPIGFYFDNDPVLLENVAVRLRRAFALQGEYIIREGYPCRYMYFIRAGYADIYSFTGLKHREGSAGASTEANGTSARGPSNPNDPAEGAELLDTLCAGEWCGELALLRIPDRQSIPAGWRVPTGTVGRMFPSPLSVVAFSNCDLYALPAAEFHDLIDQFPMFKARLQELAMRHLQLLQDGGRSPSMQPPSHTKLPRRLVLSQATPNNLMQASNRAVHQHGAGDSVDGHADRQHSGNTTAYVAPARASASARDGSTDRRQTDGGVGPAHDSGRSVGLGVPLAAGPGPLHCPSTPTQGAQPNHGGTTVPPVPRSSIPSSPVEPQPSPFATSAQQSQGAGPSAVFDLQSPTFKLQADMVTDAIPSTTLPIALSSTSAIAVHSDADPAAPSTSGKTIRQASRHTLGSLQEDSSVASSLPPPDRRGSFQGGDLGDVADDLMTWSAAHLIPQSFSGGSRPGAAGDRRTDARADSGNSIASGQSGNMTVQGTAESVSQRIGSFIGALGGAVGGAMGKKKHSGPG